MDATVKGLDWAIARAQEAENFAAAGQTAHAFARWAQLIPKLVGALAGSNWIERALNDDERVKIKSGCVGPAPYSDKGLAANRQACCLTTADRARRCALALR